MIKKQVWLKVKILSLILLMISLSLGYFSSSVLATQKNNTKVKVASTKTGDTIYSSYNPFQRGTGNSTGKLSKFYGAYETSTSYITVSGEHGGVAWCINPDKAFPLNNQYITQTYDDEGVYNILYYAEQWGWDQPNSNYVDVYVALNVYLNHFKDTTGAMKSDANVSKLLEKAKIKDAPRGKFDIKNKSQIASYNVNSKVQETDWFVPESDGNNIKYKITVPEGVTAITNTNKKLNAGVHELDQSEKFKLTANAQYDGTVKFDIPTNQFKKTPLRFVPVGADVQELLKGATSKDPLKITGVEATFKKRTGNTTLKKVSEESGLPITDVTFEVTVDGKTEELKTDENGEIKITDELDGTKVTFKEKYALDGYVLDSEERTVTIEAGKTIEIQMANKVQKGTIKATKLVEIYDEEKSKESPVYDYKKITGRKFKLTAKTDITLPDITTKPHKKGDVVFYAVTNSSGNLILADKTYQPILKEGKEQELPEIFIGKQNKYELTEETEEGYRAFAPLEICIAYGDNTIKIVKTDLGELKNDLLSGVLKWKKIDQDSKEMLENAEFRLTGISKLNKHVDLTFKSIKELHEMKLPAGRYEIKEIRYPDGYTHADGQTETLIFEIKDGEVTELEIKNKKIQEAPKAVQPTMSAKKEAKTLPQTGEHIRNGLAIFGVLVVLAVATAHVYVLRKRGKKTEESEEKKDC